MGSQLPKYGIQATIDGLPAFQKGMDSINQKIQQATKTTQDAGKKVSPLNDAFDKTTAVVGKATDKLKGLVSQSGPVGNALGGIIDKLGAIPAPALAAVASIAAIIAGVVALGAAFIALGQRGAPLQEIGHAFDNLTASVGLTSQSLLKDLRAASEGTIADFDLIKTASTALLGVTGDFGKQFGQALPQFLKIAKVEADATGRSVNELFNNLVEGVKKGTPKLIENTGLVIDQKAAYQEYAATLGITVGQLSDTDKSMALLNATLAAGAVAINTLGGAQESNADKMDRIQATITNIFDGIAVSVQPVFGTILDGVQKILNVFAGFAPYLSIIFNFVGKVVAGIVNFLGSIIPPDLPKRLFEGAAAAFGSFANGIINVANKLIFPAVIGIARFVADFLIGFSPPKEGPLSMIDKGGENVMKSWLDGISGVSLDPVKDVAAEVSAALGSIGKESLSQVNTRLGQLDKALLPFQNRLDIVKAQFDAINEPAKAALDAIDRQTAALQDAVAQGDPEAAARLRLLDQQRDAIQGQVDAQQALVDRAQIQLTLAQAQQAPERALLNIRKAYLDALAKSKPKTGDSTPAPDKAPKTTGAGGVITPDVGGAAPVGVGDQMPSVLDLIGGQGAVDDAANGLSDAFMGAIDTSNLSDFAKNSADLSTQLGRIGSVDLGSKLKDKFSSITNLFDPNNPDSIPAKIGGFVSTLFGDATTPGSIASLINDFKTDGVEATLKQRFSDLGDHVFNADLEGSPANIIRESVRTLVADKNTSGSIANFLSGLPQHISDLQGDISKAVSDLGLQDVFNPDVTGSPANLVRSAIQNLTADSGTTGSLASFFANLGPNLASSGTGISQWLTDSVVPLFDPTVKDSPAFDIVELVKNLTGDQDTADSVASLFSNLPQNISDAGSSIGEKVIGLFDSVNTFFTGDGDGTISGMLQSVVNFFADLPQRLVDALKGIGASIWSAVVPPLVGTFNSLIGLVEGLLRSVAGKFADLVASVIDGLTTAGLEFLIPQFLRDLQAGLKDQGANLSLGRIQAQLPDFLKATPGAAKGGVFGPGMMQVGEKGPEYLYNANKVGVLPHELVSVLGNLSAVLAQPQPMPIGGSANYDNSNSSINANFYGVQDSGDAMRRMAMLRARRR